MSYERYASLLRLMMLQDYDSGAAICGTIIEYAMSGDYVAAARHAAMPLIPRHRQNLRYANIAIAAYADTTPHTPRCRRLER